MIALLTGGWSKLVGWAVAAAAVIGAVLAALAEARHVGVQARENADLRQEAADRKRADRVGADVAALGDAEVVETLRKEFGTK